MRFLFPFYSMFPLTVDHITEPPGDRPSCADQVNDLDFQVPKQMKKNCFWFMIPLLCAVLSHLVMSLCNPMDCSPPGFSVHGDSPGKYTGVGFHVLLQWIFPTQGSNPGLRHCRKILYHLSHLAQKMFI